jgi:hypothetical protein
MADKDLVPKALFSLYHKALSDAASFVEEMQLSALTIDEIENTESGSRIARVEMFRDRVYCMLLGIHNSVKYVYSPSERHMVRFEAKGNDIYCYSDLFKNLEKEECLVALIGMIESQLQLAKIADTHWNNLSITVKESYNIPFF